jgi:hypothetical protein
MNRFRLLSVVAVVGFAAPFAMAQHADHGEHAEESKAGPVNKMCPIGNEPIDAEGGTVEYKGQDVAFCCSKCEGKFNAWDEGKKDAFIAEAMAAGPGEMSHDGMKKMDGKKMDGMTKVASWTGPYTLKTCPVSGEELGGDMGDPIIKVIDGREVRLCCKKCVGKFEANKEAYFKKIDMQIMHDQMRYYPAQTCLLSGEPLVEDGEDISNNFVYGNRLIRTCCTKCERKFRADPAAFIKDLDKQVADAQRDSYPLKTCPVSGEKLGGMGEPKEIVVAGRLFRLCCPMCKPKLMANPAKYIGELDAAWQAQGQFMPMMKGEHGEGHGDHDGDDAGGDAGGHGDHDHGG